VIVFISPLVVALSHLDSQGSWDMMIGNVLAYLTWIDYQEGCCPFLETDLEFLAKVLVMD